MKENTWLVVPGWQRFQHYGTIRRPLWIKNYLDLLRKDEYLDLPLAARGLLHGIWLAYADREGRLRQNDLPGIFLARARDAHLTSLSEAGLIGFSSSKPLSLNLERAHARARARPEPDRSLERARNWIRNGAARELPESQMAEILEDEFKIHDPKILEDLTAQALEWR